MGELNKSGQWSVVSGQLGIHAGKKGVPAHSDGLVFDSGLRWIVENEL